MLRRPTVHPPDLTVAEARAALAASPKLRLLLLVRDGVLVGALDRDDLAGPAGQAPTTTAARTPAAALASLVGRTVGAAAPLDETREAMVRTGRRRLAVVDDDGRLLGLLCLKRSQDGFCTDEGVAELRRARAAAPGADVSPATRSPVGRPDRSPSSG